MVDEVTDLLGDGHGRQPAQEHLFPISYGDDLFPLQREQAQENHFPPRLAGMLEPQSLQFTDKLVVDRPQDVFSCWNLAGLPSDTAIMLT